METVVKLVATHTFIMDDVIRCLGNEGLEGLLPVVFILAFLEVEFADEFLEEEELLDSFEAKTVGFLHLEKYVSHFVRLQFILSVSIELRSTHKFFLKQFELFSEVTTIFHS